MFKLDRKFLIYKKNYIFQSLLAALSMLVILLVLYSMSNVGVIASLGASCFIAFTLPHAQSSRPRYLIGGYMIGIISANMAYALFLIPYIRQLSFVNDFSYAIFGALAVGIATFLMVITDTEHPPAAGLALGLIFNECSINTSLIVMIGICVLAVIKSVLMPILKDLL